MRQGGFRIRELRRGVGIAVEREETAHGQGETSRVQPNPAVDAFYTELTARHPELDSVPEDRVDDHDYCPWSCAIDRSPGHVIMSCVWSKADHVTALVHDLARTHGLAVYDPQSDRITYPDDPRPASEPKRPWWRLW